MWIYANGGFQIVNTEKIKSFKVGPYQSTSDDKRFCIEMDNTVFNIYDSKEAALEDFQRLCQKLKMENKKK